MPEAKGHTSRVACSNPIRRQLKNFIDILHVWTHVIMTVANQLPSISKWSHAPMAPQLLLTKFLLVDSQSNCLRAYLFFFFQLYRDSSVPVSRAVCYVGGEGYLLHLQLPIYCYIWKTSSEHVCLIAMLKTCSTLLINQERVLKKFCFYQRDG